MESAFSRTGEDILKRQFRGRPRTQCGQKLFSLSPGAIVRILTLIGKASRIQREALPIKIQLCFLPQERFQPISKFAQMIQATNDFVQSIYKIILYITKLDLFIKYNHFTFLILHSKITAVIVPPGLISIYIHNKEEEHGKTCAQNKFDHWWAGFR
jgi:hypothetical protein